MPLNQIRELLVQDVWLRYLRQHSPDIAYSITASIRGATKEDGPSEILRRPLQSTWPVSEIVEPLKGYMGAFCTPDKYRVLPLPLELEEIGQAAMEKGYIYSRMDVVHIDCAKKTELFGRAVIDHSLQPEIPHPGAFSFPIKLVPANSSILEAPFTMTAVTPRLEFLSGISAFYIDKDSPDYERLRNMKACHPLLPENALENDKYIPVVGIENGPTELTPLLGGNDTKCLEIAKKYNLPIRKSADVHGNINFIPFIQYIPGLTTDDKQRPVLVLANGQQKHVLLSKKTTLPVEFANQAAYNYLHNEHGERLVSLGKSHFKDDGTVPGLVEPVAVIKHYVNVKKVLGDWPVAYFPQLNGLQKFLAKTWDFQISVASMLDSKPWKFGLEHNDFAAMCKSPEWLRAPGKIDGRTVLNRMCLPLFLAAAQPVKTPLVISGENTAEINRKILLAIALNPELRDYMIVAREMNRKVTLKQLDEIKQGKNKAFDNGRKNSVDTVRSVILETLNRAGVDTLTYPSFDEAQAVQSIFMNLRKIPVNVLNARPELPLQWDKLRFYDVYILQKVAELQLQYYEAMSEKDLLKAKALVDQAILLVATDYYPVLTVDSFGDIPYRRAVDIATVDSLVMGTLKAMSEPFYPSISHSLPHERVLGLYLHHIAPHLKSTGKSKLDVSEGEVFYLAAAAIESVLKANPHLPRKHYRGYLRFSVQNPAKDNSSPVNFSLPGPATELHAGEVDRNVVTQEWTLLLRRLTKVYRVSVQSSDNIYNQARIGLTKVPLPAKSYKHGMLVLTSFDNRKWPSAESHLKKLVEQRSTDASEDLVPDGLLPARRSKQK